MEIMQVKDSDVPPPMARIDYRKIVPIGRELQVDAGIDRIDGRKIFVSGRLLDGAEVLTEADALFVRLKPGQP